jgi:purine-binding chemotaxis protein CheW
MSNPSAPNPGRYLTFHLGSSHYAVEIGTVREVVRLCPITSVPQMPDYVRGVINLRGTVLAVLDLRAKFRMASIDYDDRACIIVLEHRAGGNLSQVGAIVDAVDDVVVLGASQLASPPDFVGAVEGRFLAGIATSTERVRAVLNMQEILASDVSFEIPDVNSLSADAGTGAS